MSEATRDNGCLHKFVGTKRCAKCGWEPCSTCRGVGKVQKHWSGALAHFPRMEDCGRCNGTGDEPTSRPVSALTDEERAERAFREAFPKVQEMFELEEARDWANPHYSATALKDVFKAGYLAALKEGKP